MADKVYKQTIYSLLWARGPVWLMPGKLSKVERQALNLLDVSLERPGNGQGFDSPRARYIFDPIDKNSIF